MGIRGGPKKKLTMAEYAVLFVIAAVFVISWCVSVSFWWDVMIKR